MIIAYIIETSKKSGGSYYQTLNLLNDIKKNFENNTKIKIFKKKNLKLKSNHEKYFYFNIYDKIILKLSKYFFFRLFFNFFGFLTSFEKMLIRNNISLIIFPTPSDLQYSIFRTKFITTIFDLCHLEHKKFSEVDKQEYLKREKFYNYVSLNAECIITNSKIIKKQIYKNYSCLPSKIFVIPFNPIEKKYKKMIIKQKFFLYPANFWEHKNHKIIIKATKILIQNNIIDFKCIFTGTDKGYLKEIKNFIKINGLKKYFEIKNFVNEKYLVNLYKNCLGVIMTSHFGPTNLPPLESFVYKRPLIYNLKFSNEISKKNCLMVNVNNHLDLASAMRLILNNKYSKKMIINGQNFIKKKNKENTDQVLKLEKFINSLNK